jgi:murein L,D-transpeptidase YcbB/YkuD
VPQAASTAERDILLTRAFLSYALDLQGGRSSLKTIDPDIQLADKPFDAIAALAAALHSHDLPALLASTAPSQPDYIRLKTALAIYRAMAAHGGWAALPAGQPDDFADNTAGSMLLRHRLAYEDTILAADPDASLGDAVKRFQLRHGLEPDGRVGVRTLAELNVSASARVMQILANMERWRWLPRTFEASFIAINVPDARLALTVDGQRVLESRVVVGRPTDPTPILRADGAGVTINPPWNVPASIARKEILPKLKANPAYLLSQDMILVDGPPGDPHGLHINWRAIRTGTFPYRVQQHPGPKNALGTIKIELPNRFDVYLHDTPGKGAFALPARDVSHGCVRVEQILPLASYALAENLDAMEKISNAVSAGETKYFPLKQRLPVYFLYWTAFAAADGTLQFRPDIYGRDQRLIAALGQSQSQLLRISGNLPKCQKA